MTVVEVERVLAEDQPTSPLTLAPLLALEPRVDPYLAMLCQPDGTIEATPQRIGNLDSQASSSMYLQFLTRAAQLQADLALTPEYSVPWVVMNEVIAGQLLPPKGALWALGFESVTPTQLTQLRTSCEHAAQQTRLIHEEFDQHEIAQKSFIDPLVYVFWTKTRGRFLGAVCSRAVQDRSITRR
jgi:hypothetical protein